MKKKILIFSILLNSIAVYGQSTVNHQVQYDDPFKENLSVAFNFFDIEMSFGKKSKVDQAYDIDAQGGAGYSLQAQYGYIAKRLSVETSFRRGIVSFAGSNFKSTFFDAGITWDISRSTSKISNDLKLGESYGGRNSTIVHYIKGVRMTQGKAFRARAGLTVSNVPSHVLYQHYILQEKAHLKSTGVYAGLEFFRKTNFKTIVDGSQKRWERDVLRLYFDVITAPIGGYGDTLFPSGVLIDEPIINQLDSLGMRTKLGGYFGGKYEISFPIGLSLNTDWRIGIKPPLSGIYIYFGFGVTFNFSTSFMGNSEMKLEDL